MKDKSLHFGFALPLVLWCLAFVGGLVVLAAGLVGRWIDDESHAEQKFVARQMALSGIAIGMNPTIQKGDPLLRQGSRDVEGYEVSLSHESGRINPVFAIHRGYRSAMLTELFTEWSGDPKLGDAASASILDWMDPDDNVWLNGAERGEYERVGKPGFPANSLLLSVREMESILNLGPILASVDGWQDFFTILYYQKINIHHVAEPILTSLAKLTPLQCRAFMEIKEGLDGIPDTADDIKFGSMNEVADLIGATPLQRKTLNDLFDTNGDMRRIESTGWCNGVRHKIVVVVAGGGSNQLLAWEEK